MKTATVRQFTAAFTTAIASAQTEGGHDALRMKLTMAALPLDARVRLLGAIESSERAHRKAA
jgi:hypothetical protein